MKQGLWSYIKAAFNARPIGMFVPPNWIGLAGFALLGFVNPGFWAIGAGAELAYLLGLSSNSRFQRLIDAKATLKTRNDWQKRLATFIGELEPEDRERYWSLERRCRKIIDQQKTTDAGPELETQGEGLSRLLWIYLRLLRTRQAIRRVLRESIDLERRREPIRDRMSQLKAELESPSLNEDLRRSYTAQIEILQQRLERRKETREKLAFVESELARIEEQVELIREQAVVTSEPHSVAERIDSISATLGGTQQWIRDQQRIFGAMDEMLTDPPPIAIVASKETQ